MTAAEVAAVAHRLMVERPVRVKVLRVGQALAHELARQQWIESVSGANRYRIPRITEPGPIGLEIVIDDHLPADVWRLCDADQTLLYDCREGTTP